MGRAPKTLMLSAITFLLTSSALGFAAAGDEEAAFLPMPQTGDRATYAISEVLFGRAESHGNSAASSAVFEWLAPRPILDDVYQGRVAAVLQYDITLANGFTITLHSFHDPETGEPIAQEITYPRAWGDSNIIGPSTPGFVSLSGRYEGDLNFRTFTTLRGACGMMSDLHGGFLDQDIMTTGGGCRPLTMADAPSNNPAGAIEIARFERDGDRFVSAVDERVWFEYEAGRPYPVAMQIPLTELYGTGSDADHLFHFTMTGNSLGAAGGEMVEAGPSAATPTRSPRTAWALDDADIDHPFPLRDAVEAALADDGTPRVADYLERFPDAYFAQAWSTRTIDGSGNAHHHWFIAWSDGDTYIGKHVANSPVGLAGLSIDDLRETRVEPWKSQTAESGDKRFLPPHMVPATLPKVSDVMQIYQAAYPDDRNTPNRYGFQITCGPGPDCSESFVLVGAGSFVLDQQTTGNQLRHLQEPQVSSYQQVIVNDDGRMLYGERMSAQAPATLDAIPTQQSSAGDEPEAGGRDAMWQMPAAPVVAGAGFLAILVGALYAAWPHLPIAGLFSRIRDDEVLDHPGRRRIYEAIRADPGIHFSALRATTGDGRGALDHHLQKLLAAGLIVDERGSGYRCFFPAGTGREMRDARRAAPVLRSAGARKIVGHLRSCPGAAPKQIADATGLSPSTVTYHAKRLRDAGVIEGTRSLHLQAGVSLLLA